MRDATELAHKYLRHDKKFPHVWCPGCGNGIVLGALIRAVDVLGLAKDEIVLVSGIGCSGRLSVYVDFNTLHTTHGRALAFATGLKLANPKLTVIVIMGDGDALAIGGNHFIHSARRNIDLTAVILNNSIYGMTGGQYSPATPLGARATTAPYTHIEEAFDIAGLAVTAGASFVARSTVYHAQTLPKRIAQAVRKPGFGVVEIITHCPTQFGRRNQQATAVAMMERQRDDAVSVHKWERLSPEERAGKYSIGVLADRDLPTYSQKLDQVRRKALNQLEATEAKDKSGPKQIRKAKEMSRVYAVRLSGAGGQGIILAGVILAEAAGLYEGHFVVQSQSYGPEPRGGDSMSEVIISDQPIAYPRALGLDLLVALTEESAQTNIADLIEGGLLLIDPDLVIIPPRPEYIPIPCTRLAFKTAKTQIAANMVALGALTSLCPLISAGAMRKAIRNRLPAASVEANLKAFKAGQKEGEPFARAAAGE